MTESLLSDEDLESYRTAPKQVTNPRARWLEKLGHKQKTFNAKAVHSDDLYQLYIRQNLNDNSDFSCGLALVVRDGKPLTLVRYNGASHVHGDIRYGCHIHTATAEAIRKGRRPESEAEETDRYATIDSALACMISDCGILGITPELDYQDLIDGH